jgi:hypothetical protein
MRLGTLIGSLPVRFAVVVLQRFLFRGIPAGAPNG